MTTLTNEQINLNTLTEKINGLFDDAFKTVYQIIKNNEEKYIKTKNYYLVNLDTVSKKTIEDLNNYINYLDVSYDYLNNDESEKDKLKHDFK